MERHPARQNEFQVLRDADSESLEKVAAFKRLTWQSLHVHSAELISDAEPTLLDVMVGSTLRDIRLVLQLVVDMKLKWSKAKPVEFVFLRSQDTRDVVLVSNEATTPLSAILHQGFIIYVKYTPVHKPPRPKTTLKKGRVPSFTTVHRMGKYSTNVDVFIDRDSIAVVLHDIVDASNQRQMKLLHSENDAVHMDVNVHQLSRTLDMSTEMVGVLLTDGRQQQTIALRLLERLQLNLDSSFQLHVTIGEVPETASVIRLRKPPSPRRMPAAERDQVRPAAVTDENEGTFHHVTSVAALKRSSTVSCEAQPVSASQVELSSPSAMATPRSDESLLSAEAPIATNEIPSDVLAVESTETNASKDEGLNRLPATPSAPKRESISMAPMAIELDRALVTSLSYFCTDGAPAVAAAMARDDLLLSFAMMEPCLFSKASRTILQLREAFQRIMLHYLAASAHSLTAAAAVRQYLWRGLHFCLWREVRDDVLSCCRFDTMARFSVLHSKLKSHDLFPGFKEPLESYPPTVTAVLEGLRIALEPHDLGWLQRGSSVWDHVVVLGLHNMKTFRITLKKLGLYCRTKTLPPVHRTYVETRIVSAMTAESTEEATFGTSLLRRLIQAIADASDASWHPGIKITDCFTTASTLKESTGVFLYLTELRDALPTLLPIDGTTKVLEEGRCAEVDEICSIVANSTPTYMFIGDRDAAAECYIALELLKPLPVVYSAAGDAMLQWRHLHELLQLAFSAWLYGSDTAVSTVLGGFSKARIGYGLNMQHVQYVASLGLWSVGDLFKAMSVEKLGVGSGVASDGRFVIVMLRLYGTQWRSPLAPVDGARIDSNFVKFILATTDIGAVLHNGALPLCQLLAVKETHGTLFTTQSHTADGVAAQAVSNPKCVTSYAAVMTLIHTQQVSGHIVVKVLEALNALLHDTAMNEYAVELLKQPNVYSDAGPDGDMILSLVTLMRCPDLPVRIVELAQKALLAVLLHPRLGTPATMIAYGCTLPDAKFGLKLKSPVEVAVEQPIAASLISQGILGHLSRAIDLCMGDAAQTTMAALETLQLRFLSLLATPAGVSWLLQDPIPVSRLVAQCYHSSHAPIVCLQAARAFFTAMLYLASAGSAIPDSDAQENMMQIVIDCILCRAPIDNDFQIEAGRLILCGVATLLPLLPWNRWILAALIPTLQDVTVSQRGSWLDRVIGCAAHASPSPEARRWATVFLTQHQGVARCTCAPTMAPRRRIIVQVAATFVAGVMKNVGYEPTAATALSPRLGSPTCRNRARRKQHAIKLIQQHLRQWLYVKRKSHGYLPVVLCYATCRQCNEAPSFLSSLVLLVCGQNGISRVATPTDVPPKLRLQAFQCLTKLWFSSALVAVAVNDLHVSFLYLTQSLHEDAAWRHVALQGLANLVWFYPNALTFVSWAVAESFWTKSIGSSWLDHVIGKVDGMCRSVCMSATTCAYIETSLRLLVVLSVDGRLANLLTKTFGLVFRLVQQWNDKPKTLESDPTFKRLRERILPMALLMMQNVLLRLATTDNFHFDVPYNELATVLNTGPPSAIQIYALNVVWALALRREGRKGLLSATPLTTAMTKLLQPVEQKQLTFEAWAVLHNCFGAVASLSVDIDAAKFFRSRGLLGSLRENLEAPVAWDEPAHDTEAASLAETFYSTVEALTMRHDVPTRVAKTVRMQERQRAYGVLSALGTSAFKASLMGVQLHRQILRCFNSMLVHDPRDGLNVWLGAFRDASSDAQMLHILCAGLTVHARVDSALCVAVPKVVLDQLVQLAQEPGGAKLQSLALQALGYLSVSAVAAKQRIQTLGILPQLSSLRPSLQLEVVNVVALATKNTSTKSLPPAVNEATLAEVLNALLLQRDRKKIWRPVANGLWSPVILDNEALLKNATIFESTITKCLRRPAELLELCRDALERALPSLFIDLLTEAVEEIPTLAHPTMLRDAHALVVQLSQALLQGLQASLPQCLTTPVVQRLVRILVGCLIVDSPTLTANVVLSLQGAVSTSPDLLAAVLGDDAFLHTVLSILAQPERMKPPAILSTLSLLGDVLASRDNYATVVSHLEAYPKGDTAGYSVVVNAILQHADASLAYRAVALTVLGHLLRAPSFCANFLGAVFQTPENTHRRYLEDTWSHLALRSKWAVFSTRGVMLELCLGAARLLAAMATGSQQYRGPLTAFLLANTSEYDSLGAPLDIAVQTYLDVTESRFAGYSRVARSKLDKCNRSFTCCRDELDPLSQIRVYLTQTLAALAKTETVRHSSTLERFIAAATSTPLEEEPIEAVQAYILCTYEECMCVPAVFRQLVFGSGVFMPPDVVAVVDKPFLYFLGRHLAAPTPEWRRVFARMAASRCWAGSQTTEMKFLLGDVTATCLSPSPAPRLSDDAKDLTHRLACLECGMASGTTMESPRFAGVRLVHELLVTLLDLFASSKLDDSSACIVTFLVQLLQWLHTMHPGCGLLLASSLLRRCVVAIEEVPLCNLPQLLELISHLFRVAPLYKDAFLDHALTNALVHCLTPSAADHLEPVLYFLWDLARHDTSVAGDLVHDTALLRQLFQLLQLPIMYDTTFQCLALRRPNAAQLQAIVAATHVLCVITSAPRDANTVFRVLELQPEAKTPVVASNSCARSVPNDRPILRTILDLMAVTSAPDLLQSLLALTRHLVRANPTGTVTRLCDHGGILVLFDCLFNCAGVVQTLVRDILQLLFDYSGPRAAAPPDLNLRIARNMPRKSVLQTIGHRPTTLERYSMAVTASSEGKRRTALRPGDATLRNLYGEKDATPVVVESVALMVARIAFFGALYPVYGHRLDDMTLGSMTTEVDFVWIEDMLRRLVVFGRLSFAELHRVSRSMTITRVLPGRSVITEPGLYVITTGKVAWHLEATPYAPHVLEKGCMVGLSTCCDGVATEHAVAMSGVVSLVLSRTVLDDTLPPTIAQKLRAGLTSVAGAYAGDKRAAPETYLSRCRGLVVQDEGSVLTSMLMAIASTKETAKINVWLLVHVIHDLRAWHDAPPTRLVQAIVFLAQSILENQPSPPVHRIVLALGQRRGATGAQFFARTWTKPLDELVTHSDVPFCNRLASVLLALVSYNCAAEAACATGQQECRCTLTARRVVVEHLNFHWISALMTLFEEQPVTQRLEYSTIYDLVRRLFAINGYRLAAHLKHLDPPLLLDSFLGDVVSLAEDDSVPAQKLLVTLSRHAYFRNALVRLPDVQNITSEWHHLQRAAVISASDRAVSTLEMLSCLCRATAPAIEPRLLAIFRSLLDDRAIAVVAGSVGSEVSKTQLAALRTLHNLCVACAHFVATDEGIVTAFDAALNRHESLLASIVQLFNTVGAVREETDWLYLQRARLFPHLHASRLLLLAEIVLYSVERKLYAPLETLQLLHTSLDHLDSFLDVPILGCILENARNRLGCIVATVLSAAPLEPEQYHAVSYRVLHIMAAAYERRHEGLLRVLVRLLTQFAAIPWFQTATPVAGTITVGPTAVALIMSITTVPWDSLKHASALCIAVLCDSPPCREVLTQDVYVAKLCDALRHGHVGMQGYVAVLARLCETKAMRQRLLAYPECLPTILDVLPRLKEHESMVAAAYVLWALWRTNRKSGMPTTSNSDTAPSLVMLLQPSVPWFEPTVDRRYRIAAAAAAELMLSATPPVASKIQAVFMQLTSRHLHKVADTSVTHQLLKLINHLLRSDGQRYFVHLQQRRALPIASLLSRGANIRYHVHVCTFVTLLLRLEPSQASRQDLQSIVGGTPALWTVIVRSSPGPLVVLRMLCAICHGHGENVLRTFDHLQACADHLQQASMPESGNGIAIAETVCMLWSLGYRHCPSTARRHGHVMASVLARLLFKLPQWQMDRSLAAVWARVATRVCRTVFQLTAVAPTVTVVQPVEALFPYVASRPQLAIAVAKIGITRATQLAANPPPCPSKIVAHIFEGLASDQRPSRPVYWRWLHTTARYKWPHDGVSEALWATILSRDAGINYMALDAIMRWLCFPTPPVQLLMTALDALLNNLCDHQWWTIVVTGILAATPCLRMSAVACVLANQAKFADLWVTATVDRAAAFFTALGDGIEVPGLQVFFESVARVFLDAVAAEMSVVVAKFVVVLLKSKVVQQLCVPNLGLLYPVLCHHVAQSVRRNRLADTAVYLSVVAEIVHYHGRRRQPRSLLRRFLNTGLIEALESAVLKCTSPAVVELSLRVLGALGRLAPDEFVPLATLPPSKWPALGALLGDHIDVHLATASLSARQYLHSLKSFLVYAPPWLLDVVTTTTQLPVRALRCTDADTQLLTDVLHLVATLLRHHKPARLPNLIALLAPYSEHATDSVSNAALHCVWHLHRSLHLSVDARGQLATRIDKLLSPSEASFGILALLLSEASGTTRNKSWLPMITRHLDDPDGALATLVTRTKYLLRLSYVYPDLVASRPQVCMQLIRTLKYPCSKAAAYALEALGALVKLSPEVAAMAWISQHRVVPYLYQHLLYGMAFFPVNRLGVDSVRKAESDLRDLCLNHALVVTRRLLQYLPDAVKPCRLDDLFGLLLNLAHYGPPAVQAQAVCTATKLVQARACPCALLDGSDRILELLLRCLQADYLMVDGLHLVAELTTTRRNQACIVDSIAIVNRIFAVLQLEPSHAAVVWNIVSKLAASGLRAPFLMGAIVHAHETIDLQTGDIAVHRSIASTVAELVQDPDCVTGAVRLQPWLLGLARDRAVDTSLLRVQMQLMVLGAASEDTATFSSVLACLEPIAAANHAPDYKFANELQSVIRTLLQLVHKFYCLSAQAHPLGFQVKLDRSKKRWFIWQHQWVVCRGAVVTTSHLYDALFRVMDHVICHPDVGSTCRTFLFKSLGTIAADAAAGSFLVANGTTRAFFMRHTPAASAADCAALLHILWVCAQRRVLVARFSSTRQGGPSLLALLCAATTGCVRRSPTASPPTSFLVTLALLCENKRFLASRPLLLSADAPTWGVMSLLLCVLVFDLRTPSAHAALAAKVFARLCSVHNVGALQHAFERAVADLGSVGVTKMQVAHAMLHAVYLTNVEFDMHMRVLVRIVHSVLVRMAAVGRIDKGVPALLHDYGLANLFLCSKGLLGEFEHTGRHDWASRAQWIQAMKEELVKFALDGYDALYVAFEKANYNPQLNVAIESTKHAARSLQTLHYVLHLLHEALVLLVPESATGIQRFCHHLELVGEWIIICLQNPETDVGFFTHQIEDLCQYMSRLLKLHQSHILPPSPMHCIDDVYPVRLSISHAHIHSWVWALLGTRPYVRLGVGAKHAYCGCHVGNAVPCRYPLLRHRCGNYIADDGSLCVSSDDALQSLDVQVWMYLPWSPLDICIGRTSVGFPLVPGTHPIEFYPEQRDKMRFDIVQPYGEVHVVVTAIDGETPATTDFPFSTCGSKTLRSVAVRGLLWCLECVRKAWRRLVSPTRPIHVGEASSHHHIGSTRCGLTDVASSIVSLLGKIQTILERCTSKDKLIGAYEKQVAYDECKMLMEELFGPDEGSFSAMEPCLLAALGNPEHQHVWDRVEDAITSVVNLYMPRGIEHFKTHLHVHVAAEPLPGGVSAGRKPLLQEVSSGIMGGNFFAVAPAAPAPTLFQRSTLGRHGTIAPADAERDGIRIIADTCKRRRRGDWQQTVLPHISMFTLTEGRSPQWYNVR
ncbi:hypothetical protein ACHHYP_04316 [Achlya hypogyna]|uniref:Uncharacterized protein n=1 Tax=Achlya hypogyna TaxID=1202772 RepID=A0A1V9Z1N9_ACHHY|nr:hypothetical protein ACHHYP_04316 [Achlya hypogyna]